MTLLSKTSLYSVFMCDVFSYTKINVFNRNKWDSQELLFVSAVK